MFFVTLLLSFHLSLVITAEMITGLKYILLMLEKFGDCLC